MKATIRRSAHKVLDFIRRPLDVLRWAVFLCLCYVAFYFAAMVLLWFTIMEQQAVNAPKVALTWHEEPFGLGVRSDRAVMEFHALPVVMEDLRLTWPLATPWRLVIDSVRAEADYGTVRLGATNLQISMNLTLPWTRKVTVAAQGMTITDLNAPHAGATTIALPKVVVERVHIRGDSADPAESWHLVTGPIIIPMPSGPAMQIDGILLGVRLNRIQPDWADREAVTAWQYAGGHAEISEASLKMLGIALAAGGDIQLKDDLGLTGDIQLQVSGIDKGYQQLGEMGLLTSEQYQMLGNVLRLIPDAGSRTYTMPVRLKDNLIYLGPSPLYKFSRMPWDLTAAPIIEPKNKNAVTVTPPPAPAK